MKCDFCKTSGANMKRCKNVERYGVRNALQKEWAIILNKPLQTSAHIVKV